MSRPASRCRYAAGHAAIETLLLAGLLVAALLAGAPSAAAALLDAVHALYRALTFTLSLP
jgi:hypothetical protein